MYVVGISGSPRKNGNTDLFLKECLNHLQVEGNFLALRDLKIDSCNACLSCIKTHVCHIQDDMVMVYSELKKADAIVLASPVYFGTISGQLKTMMDRTLCLYHGRQLAGKLGAALATTGRDGGDLALQAINKFYEYHRMLYAGGVFGTGGRLKQTILRDKQAIEDARELGRRVVEIHGKLQR